jgi:3-oxoadipate enol-lactonase
VKITINDHEHWYDVTGEGDGTPVLLIMGFGMSGQAWRPQVKGLMPHRKVAIYDNRGIGETETSKHPYGFSDLARDARALLDHLGWERAHVAGVSMGGMIAQHLALAAPERLRSLTLIATHPGGSVRHTIPTRRGLRLFLRANTSKGETRFEALRHLLYTPGYLEEADPESDFGEDAMERFAVPADRTTLKSQLRAILKHDTTRHLHRLNAIPTLVVRPGGDLLVPPRNSDRLHRLIPGSRMFSIADAGHGVTHECADEVNEQMLRHMDAAERDDDQQAA